MSSTMSEVMKGDARAYQPRSVSHDGIPASFAEFADKWSAWIKRLARSTLWKLGCTDPSGHGGEVAGDVLVKILRHWNKLVSPEQALYRIATNEARRHVHKCRCEVAQEIDEKDIPAFTPAAVDPTEMLEAAIYIEELLSHLDEIDQGIIFLRFMGSDFEQIAEQMGMPSGTIRSRYSRALKRMRRMDRSS